MLSEHRRAYLEAMGIECLVLRRPLPGARPAPIVEPLITAPAAAGVSTPPGQSPASPQPATDRGRAAGAGAAQALLGDSDHQPAPIRERRDPGAASAIESPAAPRFALSVVRAGRVVIVDEGLAGDTDPRSYLRLLDNLLFALGLGGVQITIDGFTWPLPKIRSGHVDQSAAAARQALNAYLVRHLEESQARCLLLMGTTPPQFVLEQPLEAGRVQAVPGLPAPCLHTVSAARALADTALKPLIWRDLQALRALFGSTG